MSEIYSRQPQASKCQTLTARHIPTVISQGQKALKANSRVRDMEGIERDGRGLSATKAMAKC